MVENLQVEVLHTSKILGMLLLYNIHVPWNYSNSSQSENLLTVNGFDVLNSNL